MKKITTVLFCLCMTLSLVGCSKRKWEDTYHLTYFYLEECQNCQHFRDNILPLLKKEFGDHLVVESYDLDTHENFEEMKKVYDEHIAQIIDFNQEEYGMGPLIFLEGYIAISGAANEEDFLDTIINAIDGKPLGKPYENQTFYYLKDGKVKQ